MKILNQIVLPRNNIGEFDVDFYKDYGLFVKPINYPMSTKKIESLLEIARIQKYFQCNPVAAIDILFNIELLDSQALAVEYMWFVSLPSRGEWIEINSGQG